MKRKIFTYINDERGATAAEYAIMISLVALVIIVAVTFFGSATNDLLREAGEQFANF